MKGESTGGSRATVNRRTTWVDSVLVGDVGLARLVADYARNVILISCMEACLM